MTLDFDNIDIGSDEALYVPSNSKQQRLVRYSQYAGGNSALIDSDLRSGFIYSPRDLLTRSRRRALLERILPECDLLDFSSLLNCFILIAVLEKEELTQLRSFLLRRDDISNSTKNVLQQLLVLPSVTEQEDAQQREHTMALYRAMLIRELEKLPEFRGAEGSIRLSDMLIQMDRRLAREEAEKIMSLRAKEPGGKAVAVSPHVQQLLKRTLAARIGKAAHDFKKGRFLDGIMESAIAERLPDSEARGKIEQLWNHATRLAQENGTAVAAQALDFIATGIKKVRVINAEEVGAFYDGKSNSTMGFSEKPDGTIYIGARRTLSCVADFLLEEAAHSAILYMYGSYVPCTGKNDLRYELLQAGIKDEYNSVVRRLQLVRVLPADVTAMLFDKIKWSYGEEELPAEMPVKVLKLMAQGKWGQKERELFPRITEFVEHVILEDFVHYQETLRATGHGEIRSQEVLLDRMLELDAIRQRERHEEHHPLSPLARKAGDAVAKVRHLFRPSYHGEYPPHPSQYGGPVPVQANVSGTLNNNPGNGPADGAGGRRH